MSRVLKAAIGNGAPPAMRVFDLRPIEARAQEILAAAQEALAQARAEAERVCEAARAEGREIGRREGRELGRRDGLVQGLAAAQDLRATLLNVLRDLERHRAQLKADAEHHLIRLAVRIAERVVKGHVMVDPETVRRNVAAAVELVASADQIQLALAPGEVEAVREFLPDLAQGLQDAENVHLVADERITPGGCLVRTAGGLIDAQIETQLEEIEQQLTDQCQTSLQPAAEHVAQPPSAGSSGTPEGGCPTDGCATSECAPNPETQP